MLKQRLNLSFKDHIDEVMLNLDETNTNVSEDKTKNCWSGYHVTYRNPKNFQELAIDKKFNRWSEMVDFFSQQERPYKLSQGSLKDLLYGTYKRKGMHSLSLNDLVTIEKIDRVRITKTKVEPTEPEVTENVAENILVTN